jgi:hypothetical protein
MPTGSATMTVTPNFGASTRGDNTTYEAQFTITAGNVTAFSNLRSRRSNTQRPSTGIAERTIGPLFCYRASNEDETDVTRN